VRLFEKYADKFDLFHTATAQIVAKTDYDDYEGTFTENVKGSVTGDLQPYSAEQAEKDYGLKINCQYAFYYRSNADVVPNMILRINGTDYNVKYVTVWDMGAMAMLEVAE